MGISAAQEPYLKANSRNQCLVVWHHFFLVKIGRSRFENICDLGPEMVVIVREITLFQGNLGWWNIAIWPMMEEIRRSPVEAGSWNPIIYQVLWPSQVVGLWISEPSTVWHDIWKKHLPKHVFCLFLCYFIVLECVSLLLFKEKTYEINPKNISNSLAASISLQYT